MEKEKDPRRQWQGKVSRAQGAGFERLIDTAFEYYKHTGFAFVEKTPEPVKIIKRLDGGRFVSCFLKSAQPDYKGVIKGGRAVMFEAKYTSKDRIDQSRVSEKQAEYLDRYTELGARCFVIVGYASGGVYLIPWSVWAAMKENFGRKYLTESDIGKYRVRQSWRGILELMD